MAESSGFEVPQTWARVNAEIDYAIVPRRSAAVAARTCALAGSEPMSESVARSEKFSDR